jgi:hypothetical protein
LLEVTSVLIHHCADLKLSAEQWLVLGQALGSGVFKHLKKLDLSGMENRSDAYLNDKS